MNSIQRRPFMPPQVDNVYSNGDYVVFVTRSGIRFERTTEPRCTGQLLEYADYEFSRGEVFFAGEGECVVGLKWPNGEPRESEFFRIVGGFADDLDGWRSWPVNLKKAQVRPHSR